MVTDILTLDRPLVALDLETTGVYHNSDRIVQLGFVKIYPSGEVTEHEMLINPTIPIPLDSTAVHGITDEMVAEEPTFQMISQTLWITLRECDLCGYNLRSFDSKFLTAEFARCHMKLPETRMIDPYIIWKKYSSHNLTSAVKTYLGEQLENAHSALADAKAALRVFRAQLLKHEDLPRDIDELHRLFFEKSDTLDPDRRLAWRDGVVVINFGKYAGVPLKDVDRGYLGWILNGQFSPELKVIIRDAINGKFPIKEK